MRPETWIKQFLPRSLYGRAALILVVPVVTLQLVVSSVFLQRHFEGVASQLSHALSLDLNLILETWDADGAQAARKMARAVEIDIGTPRFSGGVQRYFYDISGITIVDVLEGQIENLAGIDLRTNESEIQVLVDRGGESPVAFTTARRRASSPAPHQLLVIMVATGVLMTLVAYIFLRNQLRPIRRLAGAAEAFGKGRRMDYRPSGATEVRSAGRAFLDMRARIEGHLEQRTLMLSGVSHDLRTPLTRMRLSLDMLENSPERDELVQDIEQMEALLNTFLDFVRGDTLDDPVQCDPAEVVSKVARNAQRGGRTLAVEHPPGPAEVLLRPLALQRALMNLVSNAQRYGKNAKISLKLAERYVQFSVEDDGPGIPKDHRKDALRPFMRLDQSRNQNLGTGVGLGLAIAHDIARRHGGRLELGESESLGGLRADLTVPR